MVDRGSLIYFYKIQSPVAYILICDYSKRGESYKFENVTALVLLVFQKC